MATLTITKGWDDTVALTEAQLDYFKTDTETYLNTTKLSSANIQTDGIETTDLADLCVDATAINTAAITTIKIADGAVTKAKRATVNTNVATTSGAVSISSASYATITNQSLSFTTTGRPVLFMLQSTHATNVSSIGKNNANASLYIEILRDSTAVGTFVLGTASGITKQEVPPTFVTGIDNNVTAGTYTYTAKAKLSVASGTAEINHVQLTLIEL